MKVVHVVKSLNKSSGGPARSVPYLSDQLSRGGLEVSLVAFDADAENCEKPRHDRVKLVIHSKVFSIYFWLSFFHCEDSPLRIVRNADAIHLHGVWSPEVTLYAALSILFQKKLFLHPRGMLVDIAIKKKWLRKKIALWLYQRRIIAKCSAIFVTSEAEQQQMIRKFSCRQVVLVGNPTYADERLLSIDRNTLGDVQNRKLLFIGRLHPIKGLELLFAALSMLKMQDWHLTVAGPGDHKYKLSLTRRIKALNLEKKITMLGMVDQEKKQTLLGEADIFILPSLTENYGIVVDEALQAATPVITTTGTPWSDLPKYSCGWITEASVEGLRITLENALTRDLNTLRLMGNAGRQYIVNLHKSDVSRDISSVYAYSMCFSKSALEKTD